jgi:hypothetical protein
LPAFWRPIIVTSISVALNTRDTSCQEVGMENSKDNIPEQAEEPVIETFENAWHDEVFDRLGTAGKCQRAGMEAAAVEQLDGCTGGWFRQLAQDTNRSGAGSGRVEILLEVLVM